MQVELLGTGGYFANDKRHTACTFFPAEGIVIDAGSALFRLANRIQTPEIHLFLTHAHLDHIVGFPSLLIPLLKQQIQQLTVYATAETHAAIHNHLLASSVFPVDIPFESVHLSNSGNVRLNRTTQVHWQRLKSHPGGSMAFRIEQHTTSTPLSIGMVTDTIVDGSYTEFVRDVDLLVHECNFPDSLAEVAIRTGHSHATPVATLAHDANVRRLITVHFDPSSELDDPIGIPQMQEIFPNVELGYDCQTVIVNPR